MHHRLSSSSQIHFETAKVDRGNVVEGVTATGTLSALVSVQVGSQISGPIQKLYVDYNSYVTKGQVIAQVDPALFQAAYLQAKADVANSEASLNASRANLEKAKATETQAAANYRRSILLKDAHIISEQQFDQDKANAGTAAADVLSAQAAVTEAEAQVQVKQAALNSAQTNLHYTQVRAPVSGIVISRNVDVGQTVAAAFQAPVLFTIAEDLRKMQVDTNIGESDVGRLKTGMAVSFTVDAFPDRRFSGTVRQIRNSAQTVQNVVTYDAVIDMDNSQLQLKPGMTANVDFPTAEHMNVIRIPNIALLFRPDMNILKKLHLEVPNSGSTSKIIWVLRNGIPAPISIRTGISDGSFTEITGGDIVAGDSLITDIAASTRGALF